MKKSPAPLGFAVTWFSSSQPVVVKSGYRCHRIVSLRHVRERDFADQREH